MEYVTRQPGGQFSDPGAEALFTICRGELDGRGGEVDEGKVGQDGGDEVGKDEFLLRPELAATLLELGAQFAEEADALLDGDLEQEESVRNEPFRIPFLGSECFTWKCPCRTLIDLGMVGSTRKMYYIKESAHALPVTHGFMSFFIYFSVFKITCVSHIQYSTRNS